MDSPIVSQLFRQLFRHRPAGCQSRARQLLHQSARRHHAQQIRSYAVQPPGDRGMKLNESRWQQRTTILPQDRSAEFAEYPLISGAELRLRSKRPRKVKMLLRDFIEGTSRSPITFIMVAR